jgi:hypothetical protein
VRCVEFENRYYNSSKEREYGGDLMATHILVIMVIMLPFLAASSTAEDWTQLRRGADKNMSLHIDRDSVEVVSENLLRAWVKYQYQQHFKGKREYNCMKCTPEKLLSHVLAHKEFDCGKRKSRFLWIVEYYSDKSFESEQLDDPWKIARRGSEEENLINYFCSQIR